MVDLTRVNEALNKYIRPQSFPLAVRMCDSEPEFRENVRLPKRDFGILVTVCQGLAMARRYGWTIAIGKDDQVCPHGHAVLGWVASRGYLDGSLAEKAGLGPREKFAKDVLSLDVLEYEKYTHLLAAPIDKAEFDPHFILVFGNPAQVALLVQSAASAEGGPLHFIGRGGIGCSLSIARTMVTEDCQVVLSGAGDRCFALTQDHEMAFTIPVNKLDSVIEGLGRSHRMGQRYPTPAWLRFEGQLPAEFYKFTKLLKETD